MHKIKQFFRNIHNLVRWFPIIWKDRDWDDHFIWEILKFKLKNQAEYIGYHDRHMSAKRDAETMMLCTRLIDKIQNEYYGIEYQNYHETKIEFIDSQSHPGMYEMEIREHSENFDEYFKKYPRIYQQVKSKDKNNFKTAFEMSCINEKRAHKLLFKILEQNIQRWWD